MIIDIFKYISKIDNELSLENLAKLVSEKKVDILNLDNLDKQGLKNLATELGLTTAKKSQVFLLTEIKAVSRVFLAGEGT